MAEGLTTTLNSITRVEQGTRFEGFGRCQIDTGERWTANSCNYETHTGIIHLEAKRYTDRGKPKTLDGVCYKEISRRVEMKGDSFVYLSGIIDLNGQCYEDTVTRMTLKTGRRYEEPSKRMQLDSARRYEEPSFRQNCVDSQRYVEASHRVTLNNSFRFEDSSNRMLLDSARRYEEKSTKMDLFSRSFEEPSTRIDVFCQQFEDKTVRFDLDNGSSQEEPTVRFDLSTGCTYREPKFCMELVGNTIVEPSVRAELESGRFYKEPTTRMEVAGSLSEESSHRMSLGNGCRHKWDSGEKITMFGYRSLEPSTRFELSSYKFVEEAGQARQRGLQAGLEMYGHGEDSDSEPEAERSSGRNELAPPPTAETVVSPAPEE